VVPPGTYCCQLRSSTAVERGHCRRHHGGRREKALPLELEKFMSSTKSTVLVSLGNNIPRNALWVICDAFDKFVEGYFGVVWRMEDSEICSDKKHVMLMPWIPQNDLLADHRVEMFISSGNFNSIVESVYHTKPLIILPYSTEQRLNAAAAESKGFAIVMNPDFVLDDGDIRHAIINLLLLDPDYKRATLRASAILRDQRDTPAQPESAKIDHVIKYGNQHLQSRVIKPSQLTTSDVFPLLMALPTATMMYVSMLLLCICCCSCSGCCWWFVKCVKTCKKKLERMKTENAQVLTVRGGLSRVYNGGVFKIKYRARGKDHSTV